MACVVDFFLDFLYNFVGTNKKVSSKLFQAMKKSLFFAFWMTLMAGRITAQNVIEVSGEYHGQVLWEADTVKVVGDVVIEAGDTGHARLIVAPGTFVMAEGYYKVFVHNGSFYAQGTETEPIVFSARDITDFNNPNVDSGWKGLYAVNDSGGQDSVLMEHCSVHYAKLTPSSPDNERKGAGLYVDAKKYCRLSHCSFINNKTYGTTNFYDPGQGGGVYVNNPGTCIIEHCLFKGNFSNSRGGGLMAIGNRSFKIHDCEFYENTAQYGSALVMGLGMNSVGPEVCNNYIHANHGNALYLGWDVVTGKLHDNVIVNNEGMTPVIGATSPNTSLYYNNTIVLNQSTGFMDDQTGGIWTIGQQKIYNNIIYFNGASFSFGERQIGFDHTYGNPTIFNNCFSYYHDYPGSVYGEPDFVMPAYGLGPEYDRPNADWSLQNTSPCINAGSTEMSGYPATDYYGNPRIKDGIIDIGATEFQDFEAVNEMPSELLYKVFPNPGTNRLNIMAIMEQPLSVSVYDMTGRLMFYSESASPLTEIDTEDWPSGMYFWKVCATGSTSQNSVNGKWIKQ